MYARKRLDIGWIDLASGLVNAGLPRDRAAIAQRIEQWFSPEGRALCTLSIRSGLELYLEQLALPKGSEVLMSAMTIPDMWKVVEHHGLVPVPVDVDARTLAPKMDVLLRAASSKTRALLVAHLYGTRFDLAPYARVCKERGWLLLEDCAQAFTGPDYKGHPAADVAMFSFGPIKTSAALAGGVLVVRDAQVMTPMRAAHAAWPVQGSGLYAKRVLKYAGLKAVTTPVLYGGFVKWCELKGTTQDAVIQSTVRGFAGGDFWQKIRHQPSAPLLSVIERRVCGFDGARVARRTAIGRRLVERIGAVASVPGIDAPFHSYWVFTLLVDDPARVVAHLRAHGYDATTVATLSALAPPPGREALEPREARAALARTVYLPVYPELPERKLEELAQLLRESASSTAVAPRDIGLAGIH
ncbi:MAG: DegT/DnrJ/EryC1/StrS family aminotransferase [Planctomycetes bacterium]|nr:DegT/DnrJ/EryC1/StrS family aminotransferase [Planctomycetota bacterium]